MKVRRQGTEGAQHARLMGAERVASVHIRRGTKLKRCARAEALSAYVRCAEAARRHAEQGASGSRHSPCNPATRAQARMWSAESALGRARGETTFRERGGNRYHRHECAPLAPSQAQQHRDAARLSCPWHFCPYNCRRCAAYTCSVLPRLREIECVGWCPPVHSSAALNSDECCTAEPLIWPPCTIIFFLPHPCDAPPGGGRSLVASRRQYAKHISCISNGR